MKRFIPIFLLLLAGCASNAPVSSTRHVTSAVAPGSLEIHYLERNLAQKGQAVEPVLAQFGYFELGAQLVQHGPGVLEARGLRGSFDYSANAATRPTASGGANPLLLQFREGRLTSQTAVVKSVSLLLTATLLDGAGKQRLWSGQFRVHLGHDPALGIGRTTVVNRQFVNDLLTMVLDTMAKDRVL